MPVSHWPPALVVSDRITTGKSFFAPPQVTGQQEPDFKAHNKAELPYQY